MIYNSFLAKNISAAIPLAIPAGTDVCNTSLHPPPDHNPVTACRPCRGLGKRGKRLIYRALPPIGVCGKRGTSHLPSFDPYRGLWQAGIVASYRALTPAGVFGNRDAHRPTELLSLRDMTEARMSTFHPRVLKARNLNNPTSA